MRGVNQVTLMGNTGNAPELKYTQGGTAVATFSLATTESYKDRDGNKKEETQWHRCKAFGKLAEVIGEYVGKGDPLFVQGGIRYGKYTGSDGVERYATEIRVEEIRLLGGKRDSEQRHPAQRREPAPAKPANFDDVPFDDDIPF